MTRCFSFAAGTLVSLVLCHMPVQAGYPDVLRQVDSFYARYLGRCIDGPSAQNWLCLLQRGQATVPGIEVFVLATDEYYHRQGCTPPGFIAGLYRDVLGQQPDFPMMGHWLERMRCGCRNTVVQEFLAYYRSPVVPGPALVPVEPIGYRGQPVLVPPYRPAHPNGRIGFRFAVNF